ncbi:MAG: hypothetical protein ACLQVN_05335 [Bryobacteraceae bacterium]
MVARLFAMGLVAAALASAQRSGRSQGGNDMPMAMSEPSRMDRISAMLDLNKDQKKQIRGILDGAQKEAAPVRDELARSATGVGDLAAEGKTGDELKPALDAYAQAEARMAAIEMQAFAKIYQALDKDQQPKSRPVFLMMTGIFNGKNWDTAPAR